MSHGWRWIDYQFVDEDVEREHMRLAVESLTRVTGSRPLGWYTGRLSPNTRRLVVEHGGFLYDADAYNDDLPYWVLVDDKPHLVVPYTLDNNDMKFGTPQGFNTGDDFFTYLRDAFDTLYAEGAEAPKMMSVGPACAARRAAGPAGRARPLPRPRRQARPRLDLPPPRHRQALERHAPVPRPLTLGAESRGCSLVFPSGALTQRQLDTCRSVIRRGTTLTLGIAPQLAGG